MQLYVPTAELLAVLLSRAVRMQAAAAPDTMPADCFRDPHTRTELDAEAAACRVRAASEVLSALLSMRRLPNVLCKALADFSDPDQESLGRLLRMGAGPSSAAPGPLPSVVALHDAGSDAAAAGTDGVPEAVGALLRGAGPQSVARHRQVMADRLLSSVAMSPHGAAATLVLAGCLGDPQLARAALAVAEAQDAVLNPQTDGPGATALAEAAISALDLGPFAVPVRSALSISARASKRRRAPAGFDAARRRKLRLVPTFWNTVAAPPPSAGQEGAEAAAWLDQRAPSLAPSSFARGHFALGPAWDAAFAPGLLPRLRADDSVALACDADGHVGLAPDADSALVTAGLSAGAPAPAAAEEAPAGPPAAPPAAEADPSLSTLRATLPLSGPQRQREIEMAGLRVAWRACKASPVEGFRLVRAARLRERGRIPTLLADVAAVPPRFPGTPGVADHSGSAGRGQASHAEEAAGAAARLRALAKRLAGAAAARPVEERRGLALPATSGSLPAVAARAAELSALGVLAEREAAAAADALVRSEQAVHAVRRAMLSGMPLPATLGLFARVAEAEDAVTVADALAAASLASRAAGDAAAVSVAAAGGAHDAEQAAALAALELVAEACASADAGARALGSSSADLVGAAEPSAEALAEGASAAEAAAASEWDELLAAAQQALRAGGGAADATDALPAADADVAGTAAPPASEERGSEPEGATGGRGTAAAGPAGLDLGAMRSLLEAATGDAALWQDLSTSARGPDTVARVTARALLQLLHDSALRELRRSLVGGSTQEGPVPADRIAWLADQVRHWLGAAALPLDPLVTAGLPLLTAELLDAEARLVQVRAASRARLIDEGQEDDAIAWLQGAAAGPSDSGTQDAYMAQLGFGASADPVQEAAAADAEAEGEEHADEAVHGSDDGTELSGPWAEATATHGESARAWDEDAVLAQLHPLQPAQASRRLRRVVPRITVRRNRAAAASTAFPGVEDWAAEDAGAPGAWDATPPELAAGLAWSAEAESRTVMLTGLPLGCTQEDVEAALGRCGEIDTVRLLDSRAAALPHALRTWRRNVRRVMRGSRKHRRRRSSRDKQRRLSRRDVVSSYARDSSVAGVAAAGEGRDFEAAGGGATAGTAAGADEGAMDVSEEEEDDEIEEDEEEEEEEEVDDDDDDDEDEDEEEEDGGVAGGVSASRARKAGSALIADPTLTDTPAGRVALASAQVDLLIDLASVRPGAFRPAGGGKGAGSRKTSGLPRAVKRRSAELLEAALLRFPVHAFVTFADERAAAVATSDTLRLFGVQVGPRACRVLPASEACHVHVTGVPVDMRPAAVAAALAALLHEQGLRVGLADGDRMPPQALCGGEVVLRCSSLREALMVEQALRGAELMPGHPIVAGFSLPTEWQAAGRALPPRARRRPAGREAGPAAEGQTQKPGGGRVAAAIRRYGREAVMSGMSVGQDQTSVMEEEAEEEDGLLAGWGSERAARSQPAEDESPWERLDDSAWDAQPDLEDGTESVAWPWEDASGRV
ncbi:hypothetical protein FNF29_00942 [Cafeteria roenbergensis]|uniref:RRM domain-containing protein n=1 Tax=Cafeteria roenbergensis TaxID=33653 RepID=A0A5A8CUM9_CAFRO|nr:hypothetical protein FNF29_00942 [Cafeteria roenbergensis]|eukprot:KAA0156832.1 hypothetical protein FNF29_00942 [Cafeteria roenbergensis]